MHNFTFVEGEWHFYVNGGQFHAQGNARWALNPIPGGGEVVLGQSSRSPATNNDFDASVAFLGEMAFINIWHEVRKLNAVRQSQNTFIKEIKYFAVNKEI